MTAAKRLNVLIAHAEPLIQIGLEGALSSCGDLAVRSVRGSRYLVYGDDLSSIDVAVADLDTGVTLARSGLYRVLIVTTDESEIGIRGAMEAGVRGYILQNSTPAALAEAVRSVGGGGTAIDPRALTKMLDSLNGDKLTDRETDVLRLIILGWSNKAVAKQLGIAVGTAKCHVKQLMAKLNAQSRTEAANIAQRRGLVRPDPGSGARSLPDSGDRRIGAAVHVVRRLPNKPSDPAENRARQNA